MSDRQLSPRPLFDSPSVVRRHPSHRAASLVTTLAMLLAMLCGVAMVGAVSAPRAMADPGEDDEQSVPTMLILDASGSMKETDGDDEGSTRMDAAKKAASDLVDGLPKDAQLGLEVYGAHTGNTAADRAKGCKDVDVVTPVGKDNASDLKKGIDGAKASGYTPIGTALRKAAKGLPDTGDRAIVLVSDGIDSCAPPPPCDVAEELEDQGVDLTIHAIGFRVDDDARADLSCIAKATGGTYTDAQDGDQLSEQLVQRATRTMQGYEVSGDPVDGGDTLSKAAPVEPGVYLDSLDKGKAGTANDGSSKYYAVKVADGERVHASATVVPPPGNASSKDWFTFDTTMDIVGQDGSSCTDPTTSLGTGQGPSEAGDLPLVVAADSYPRDASDTDDSCSDDTVYIKVTRVGSAHKDTKFPLELVVAKEEPGAAPKGKPQKDAIDDTKGAKKVAPKSKEPVTLGRSFAQATAVEPGSFVTDLVPGDMRMVKIPVAEGQRLRYRAEILDPGEQPTDSPDTSSLSLSFYNPLRQPVVAWGGVSETVSLDLDDDTNVLAGGMPAPIRAANRGGSDTPFDLDTASHWAGGDQYVMVSLSRLMGTEKNAKNVPVKVLITLEADGKPQQGVDLVTDHEPPKNESVDDQGRKGDAASDGGGGADASDGGGVRAGAGDARTSGHGRGLLIVGAGLAALIAIGAGTGAVVLIRRRG
jgi:Ca-activated chloride channel family protein